MRVAILALAAAGTVWTVGVRVSAGRRAPPCDQLPATAGLFLLAAAALLPVVSLAADRRLERLASLRKRPLPACPILFPKAIVCLADWAVLAIWASALALLLTPSAEAFREWRRMMEAGWLWAFLLLASSLFAAAATARVSSALVLDAALAIVAFLSYRTLFDLPLDVGGGHVAKAIVAVAAGLWLLAAACLALRSRRVPPAGRWVRARLGSLGCTVGAMLGMALVAPASVVLSLDAGEPTWLTRLWLSPDGRFVTFAAYYEAWPFDPYRGHCCGYVLNVETGRATRLTRFERSGPDIDRPWSPKGRYLAYLIYPGPLRAAWLRLSGRSPFPFEEALGVFDTQTGLARGVRHGAIHYGSEVKWVGEGVIRIRSEDWHTVTIEGPTWGATGEFRYDAESGTLERVGPPTGTGMQEALPSAPGEALWRLDDPMGRGYVGVFRRDAQPGAEGGTFELRDARGGVPLQLGWLHVPPLAVYAFWAFSPSGRWLLYPTQDADGHLSLWHLELASGERRKLDTPRPLPQWHPHFTPDETRLVWTPRFEFASLAPSESSKPRFYIQGLPSGRLLPLEFPRRLEGWEGALRDATVGNSALYFIGGAHLYRVPLDGTAPGQLVPPDPGAVPAVTAH